MATKHKNADVEKENIESKNETAENEEVIEETAEPAVEEDELAKTKDLLLRTAAEFDNYKKRTEREKLGIAEYAKASVIKTLLPVIDNAGRAAESGSDDPAFNKGAELIIKQLLDIIPNLGIVETAKVGDPFDPQFHEAVMHIEDPDQPENCIVEVLQKGYKLNDTVLRPAMVKVAN